MSSSSAPWASEVRSTAPAVRCRSAAVRRPARRAGPACVQFRRSLRTDWATWWWRSIGSAGRWPTRAVSFNRAWPCFHREPGRRERHGSDEHSGSTGWDRAREGVRSAHQSLCGASIGQEAHTLTSQRWEWGKLYDDETEQALLRLRAGPDQGRQSGARRAGRLERARQPFTRQEIDSSRRTQGRIRELAPRHR